MLIECPHSWNVSPAEAGRIQDRLRTEVIDRDVFQGVRLVAGIDVAYEEEGKIACAAVAVLDFAGLELVESTLARRRTSFPYIPGLLSFREIPAVLDALLSLRQVPDLLLCDGHGLAHPRRFGLACHVGVVSQIPSIGVAKTRFVGSHEAVPLERGSWQPLRDGSEVIGAVLCTSRGVKPVYVSIGHKISLETAVDYVLRCSPRYRLPETTRIAHRLASGSDRPLEHRGH